MKDRPILFSAPMVRALLDGSKTQTRRTLKPQPRVFEIDERGTPCQVGCMQVEGEAVNRVWLGSQQAGVLTGQQVRFAVGDRLWVRESWQLHSRATDLCTVAYKASVNHSGWTDAHEQFPDALAGNRKPKPFQEGWRPSIHMPRWASRLTLTVTDVRIERLQDISRGDAMDEGCPFANMQAGPSPVDWYRDLWNQINGPDEWEKNPWVAALTFTVEKRNIDQ